LSAGLMLGAMGCSQSEPQTALFDVTGCVQMDGSPLANAAITFIPRDGTKGTGAFGATDEDGHYELKKSNNKDGIEAGQYTVVFSKFAMPNGSSVPEGKSPIDAGAREVLPRRLTAPSEREAVHVATVKPEEENQTFNFQLKGGKKAAK
jgi:hypothetical protein